MNENIKSRADKVRWFNAMDFGTFQTRGREPEGATYFNGSLFGVFDLLQSLDLRGMSCIDIGVGSGLVACGLKKLGAKYVAGADPIPAEAIPIAFEASGQEIDFKLLGVEHLRDFEPWHHQFDVVVSSGLMYHLLNPFELVYAASKLLKNNGLFILQSLVKKPDPTSSLYFNLERIVNGDQTTFYVPGVNAVIGMLKAASFDILARRDLTKIDFTAFLARKVSDPKQFRNRTPLMQKAHNMFLNRLDYPYGGYNFKEFLYSDTASTVQIKSPVEAEKTISEEIFKNEFPFNPTVLSNPVGRKF